MARSHSDFSAHFLETYQRYVSEVLLPTRRRLESVFDEWQEEAYWSRYVERGGEALPKPVQRLRIRIKRPESVVDKCVKLRDEFPHGPTEDSLPTLRDFLGARVVTYFLSHLWILDREIRSGRHFEVFRDVPPRSYMSNETLRRIGLRPEEFALKGRKPSGYASLHYFIRLKENPEARFNPVFELQTRTMLEEVWGEVEHALGYKPGQQTEFSVSRAFRVISRHLEAVDDHFEYLYDRLRYLQARSTPEEGDPLNAENLPKVLERAEIVCGQNEIDGLLDILELQGVRTVSDFKRIARPELLEAVRSEFTTRLDGDEPVTAFHIVSALADLQGGGDSEHARQHVRAKIHYVEVTRQTRLASHKTGRVDG